MAPVPHIQSIGIALVTGLIADQTLSKALFGRSPIKRLTFDMIVMTSMIVGIGEFFPDGFSEIKKRNHINKL